MMAGSDTLNGAASAVTDSPGSAASRITSARRVGSASAPNVRSRVASETLTMWLSIEAAAALSTLLARADDDAAIIAPVMQAADGKFQSARQLGGTRRARSRLQPRFIRS